MSQHRRWWRWTRGAAALALAAVAGLAAAALWGGTGSAQSYTAPYYPVPVIETVAGENNVFRLKIMRCAKSSADSAESSAAACSSSELTQAAEYRAKFTVEISGAAGGLIWADHATRPSWQGSICTNQSGRTPASTCTTNDAQMRQADQSSGNRSGTAAVVPELFRFAPPPGSSSMTITVKLPGQHNSPWDDRVHRRSGNLVVRDLNHPYYPLFDDALTTRSRTLSFTESMAEASLLSDAGGTAWDFVRVNGQTRYWARDALLFKIGVSDDYMVNQATITVSGPTGSFIKPAPSESGRSSFEADCTARAAGAAMNSCVLTPVSIAGFPAGQLTHNPPSGLERRERLMLFSPPASGSGTATITVSTARTHGPSSTATDTATISIRYAATVPSNLGYAYPVPKLAQDFTPAERDEYAQVMSLGTWQLPHIRWEQEPFSNARVKVGDRLLTAFVGIDARSGDELELVGGPGETPVPTNVFDSYLPWWSDVTAAPGDAGLCPAGASGRYAYAPCRDANTLRVQGAAAPTTDDQVISRQTARADGKTFWSIPQQDGSGYPLPSSVPTGNGRTTTFGLQELRSPGDGSGVKLVTRAATGTVTMSASRQPIGGSATSPEFAWRYDTEDLSGFVSDGHMIEVAAGLKTTFTVPAGRTLEAACMHYWSLATVAQSSQSLLRTHIHNLIEQRMWRFANVSGLYDLDYYQQFYGFTAASQPATGTTPRHPFCTNWAIEGRYNVMRHQRYLAVANVPEITTAALTTGAAGDRHQLALPTWGTGSRHIFVAVPASMGEVLSLELAGGTTIAASALTRLTDREISGTTYKVWVSNQTVPQTASGATTTIVQQSPSILRVYGPAYWRTAEAAADPTKKSQVLQVGYGTPYELLNCERPPQNGGDMLCKLVDLHANPPQLVFDSSLGGDIVNPNVVGRIHGIRGATIEVAWGLAGSDWQGQGSTPGSPGTNPSGTSNLPAGDAPPDESGAIELFGPATGSAGSVALAASLPDDADQVLQETDDRALRIGPTAIVTAPQGKDITIGCIETFGSRSPATVTWRPTGAEAGAAAPACAYDDLLDGSKSYLVITGPATWPGGSKRLPIGTGTGFPVLQCDEVKDADEDGDWPVNCAVKNAAGEYPRFVVDAGAASGSTIRITASFEQAGSAPDRRGWRVSWREGTGRIPNTRWTSQPAEAERGTELFGQFSFPVRDIRGVGSVVLSRADTFLDLVLADSDEALRLSVRNGEGNTAEQEDVSAITIRTSGGALRSAYCEQQASCTLDMAALRPAATASPSLLGAIPLTLRTPREAGQITATAIVVAATGEAVTGELEIGVRGPAENLDAGDVGDRDLLRSLALAGRLPLVHHHATPEDDDRDIANFPLHAFDALVQDAIFPLLTTQRILNAAGEVQSGGFVVTEQCPLPDPRISRLSCKMVVRVIAPESNPLPRGRYRLEIAARGGLQDYADFLVVGPAKTIEVLSASVTGRGPGDHFDFEVLVLDDDGMPVADGTSVWWEARTRNAPLDAGGSRVPVAVIALQPLVEERTPTKAGKASGEMLIAGREIGILYARAGGTRENPEVATLAVVDTGVRAACRGDAALGPSRTGPGGGLFTIWIGPDGCRASEMRSLLDGAGRAISLWNGVDWIIYSERDGERLPGSSDFTVRSGSLLLISAGPPG